MRLLACLAESYWEFSVTHAVYLYNCTPMKRLDWNTPSTEITKSEPDISHLRIFGCAAYVFIHKEQRANKLAPKSELMIYLGHKFGNPSNMMFMRSPQNRLFFATTALFDETRFPKCEKAKVPTVTQVRGKPNKSGAVPIADESDTDGPAVIIGDDGDSSDDDPFTPPFQSDRKSVV